MGNCNNCGQTTSNPAFCSRSCSASYNNSKFPKRKIGEYSLAERVCPTCHETFRSRNKSKFCSKKCFSTHRQQLFDQVIIENNGFLPNAVNNTIRSFLIRRNGNNCMLCGMDADNWHGKSLTLIVDHINGHANDNSLDNLRVICPNCDSQTDTYKGANRGNSTRSYYIVQK